MLVNNIEDIFNINEQIEAERLLLKRSIDEFMNILNKIDFDLFNNCSYSELKDIYAIIKSYLSNENDKKFKKIMRQKMVVVNG